MGGYIFCACRGAADIVHALGFPEVRTNSLLFHSVDTLNRPDPSICHHEFLMDHAGQLIRKMT
jgi:hypothetical protein